MIITIIRAPNHISADVYSQKDVLQYSLKEPVKVAYKKRDGPYEALHTIEVPFGFITDLASVPKIPIIYGALKEVATVAPTVHDYIYRTTSVDISKEEADLIFYNLMLYEKVDKKKAKLMYEGVDKFGESSYKTRTK